MESEPTIKYWLEHWERGRRGGASNLYTAPNPLIMKNEFTEGKYGNDSRSGLIVSKQPYLYGLYTNQAGGPVLGKSQKKVNGFGQKTQWLWANVGRPEIHKSRGFRMTEWHYNVYGKQSIIAHWENLFVKIGMSGYQ